MISEIKELFKITNKDPDPVLNIFPHKHNYLFNYH